MDDNTQNSQDHALITYGKKGEMIDYEEVQVVTRLERRHFKKGEFFMTNFSFESLVLEKDYGRTELRLLAALKLRLDYDNRIKTFRQRELAEQLKTDQSSISKTIKRLVEDKIIYKRDHDWYFSDAYIKGAGGGKRKS